MTELPVVDDKAKVVVALDVLEHVVDHHRGLRELIRITQPGGLIVMSVPAFGTLWSDWDEALNHKRRYSRRVFLGLIDRNTVSVVRCVYINSVAFLPILVYRTICVRLGLIKGTRLEDKVFCPFLNRVLYYLFIVPACWRFFSPPFGVSLFCILQKKA
jgi:SAM-dependent methyltransferase